MFPDIVLYTILEDLIESQTIWTGDRRQDRFGVGWSEMEREIGMI